ncbi:MAG: hypothetical protein AAF489_01930 [Bacteroidota bacterium]
MIRSLFFITLFFLSCSINFAQNQIPLDTLHWNINARAYVLEQYQGKDAIYIQGGIIELKDDTFLNGTIEFDVYLKQEQAFPGVAFRISEDSNAEQFYLRAHLPGKPDATQAAGRTKGITPWQLYFGSKYSFPHQFNYDNWTHVKIVVNGDKAQVFMDYSEEPQLSWHLFHEAKEGKIAFSGGRFSGMHLANISIDRKLPELINFNPGQREPIDGLIQEWEISDVFEEKLLENTSDIKKLIKARKWGRKIQVEEGTAANISRQVNLRQMQPANTVFAKVEITSEKNELKLFEFGYSDRVVAILNGNPIYKGMNNYRSRDYRYLGTVGLFDAIYLPLKKGKNTLLLAVSEDFGGWLVTGRLND